MPHKVYLSQGQQVHHLVGTQNEKPGSLNNWEDCTPDCKASWMKHWRVHTGTPMTQRVQCSHQACNVDAVVGAHIILPTDQARGSKIYIIPTCQGHNNTYVADNVAQADDVSRDQAAMYRLRMDGVEGMSVSVPGQDFVIAVECKYSAGLKQYLWTARARDV
eukprot:GFUD01029977.1.p1 GENE.GFUD01029977.1~~GFUD01029977.1.p1  ORF type:complete len:174 (+),score=33.66 GFUD01029977.1:38-523(+)